MSRRLLNLLPCTVIAILVWAFVPNTFLERGFLHLTVRPFASPPFFITPIHTDEGGYILRTLRESAPDLPASKVADVVIGDDVDQVFQSFPPSPVDFAIILKNLRRLGKESVAIGTPLYWEDPDMISLAALDQQLASFSPAITSAPLSRRPISSPLPPAFRQASIPLSDVQGDVSGLPIVNHLSIPDVILGGDSAQAGFSILESEIGTAFPNLIARWEDRVVFSFHLLAAIDHFDSTVSQTEILMGEYISIAKGKAYIPLDEYGRLAIAPPETGDSDHPSIRAEALIDAPDDFLAKTPFEPVLIRSKISSLDSSSLDFSEKMVPTVLILSDPLGTNHAKSFHRPSRFAELLFLSALLSLIYGLGNYRKATERRRLVILAVSILVLHFIAAGFTSTWPPTLPAIAMALAAIPLTKRKGRNFIKGV